jgi:hypothetical protein
MDWGLASATSETSKAAKIHAFGTVSGTPAYMAPEMAKGELERIGPWSDIYLLGALLYRIITKSPPHVGATVMDCLEAAAENDILPAWQESELLEVALKAMESDPAARFPSVKAFQTAVRDCQRHRESILLANSARETLRMANESKEYMDFARALFGCEEALKLWENNRTASELVPRVREAYAACALEKGDLDLALSLLEEGGLEEGELYQKVKRALRHRAAGERRVKAASRVAAGAIKAQSDKAARLRTYRLGLAILGGAALLAAGVAVWALLDAAKARAALRDATATAAQTPPAETKTTPAIPADAGKTP